MLEHCDFIESSEDLGLKIGTLICLDEYMEVYEDKRPKHSFTVDAVVS